MMDAEKQAINLIVFKSGEISNRFEVSTQTIRRWVHRYSQFFSEASQIEDRYKVRYTPDDALLITTIQYLSGKGIGLDDIEAQLEQGTRHGQERVQELIANSFLDSKASHQGLNPKLVELELKQTRQERDQNAADKRLLEEKIEVLLREIAELKYHLGMVEGELNLLRRQADQSR